MKKIVCGCCQEYGDVHKVKVIETGDVIHICYECDSLWSKGNNYSEADSTVDDYLEKNGLSGKWDELFEEINGED